MIRFAAFSDGQPIQQLSLNGTYMFAQDEIPVRSQLEFADGQFQVVRHGEAAVGLATLWDVKQFGKVLLQTTRLPERAKPYNLNVELARSRLLRISQKREEWGMAEPKVSEEHHELLDDALNEFVAALCHLDETEKAAQFADESLSLAMKAGEAMALSHASMFLERRCSTQGFGRHSFGCCFDPGRIGDQKYLKYIKDNFHFVTLSMTWRQIEPKEQERNFDLLDKCINWLNRNRIAVKVGPLLSFSPIAVPDWLFIWENDFEQVREMAYDHITRIAERYGNKVQAWEVISGMNVDNCFKFNVEQIIEMTRSAALAAKHAAPRSLALVELTEPWGEYYAYNQRTVPPIIYADMICQSGVNFDGFGLKVRFGRGGGGMRVRDLLEFSSLLDRFAAFAKPVHLASVQVPSQADKRDNNGRLGEAGYWHGPWSEQNQAEWLGQIYRIALSKPHVETVTWQDLADRDDGILQNGGLLKKDLSPKPAFAELCQLKGQLVHPKGKKAKKKP